MDYNVKPSLLLVVDLDRTLLKTDMLHECFWSVFAKNWKTPFVAVRKLLKGKVELKSYLALNSAIDVSLLPYNELVLKYIKAYRAKGGRVALVTATHQLLANQIAEYLKVFDEVHGSEGGRNLKGPMKAQYLTELYGEENFCYMGDSISDLDVWKVSGKIVTVNATKYVREQAQNLGKPIEHMRTHIQSLYSYVSALRPHQWLKNILIFLPMLAAHEIDSNSFISSLLALITFCLIASNVYILNDLLDLCSDRAHPRKLLRPFASGALPISHGTFVAFLLLLVGFTIAVFVGWYFFIAISTYYIITLLYSLGLKRKIAIDICILAGLYTMRIIAGSVATGIELSVWLLAFSIFFFLSLASIKRQAELVDLVRRNEERTFGRGYNADDLPIVNMISITAGYISILVLALYINSPNTLLLYSAPQILWGICCVLIYWITRIVFITHRGSMQDDPVLFAIKDTISQICLVIIVGLVIAGALL